jgi:hypothetical protein
MSISFIHSPRKREFQFQQWMFSIVGKVSESKPGAPDSWGWKSEAYFVRELFQPREDGVPGLAAASAVNSRNATRF